MEKEYVVPATTFLSGLAIWLLLLILHETGVLMNTMGMQLATGLLTGGLLVFSGYRCRKALGPRVGNVIRAGVLIVMALISFWRIGDLAAGLLLASSIPTAIFALLKSPAPAAPAGTSGTEGNQ